eukprot:5328566-Pyramimonas_sp.AAC.1
MSSSTSAESGFELIARASQGRPPARSPMPQRSWNSSRTSGAPPGTPTCLSRATMAPSPRSGHGEWPSGLSRA